MRHILISRLALAALGFGAAIAVPNGQTQAVEQSVLRTLIFKVGKMTCAACPITVKTAMSRVEGVHSVEIDFDSKTATVRFDPAITTAAAIARASSNAGYPAHIAENRV